MTITNIPGDVKLSYPYLLDSGDVDESLHNIAFYFAPNAETLDDIEDASTIVRLSTVTPDYAGSSDRENRFVRQYASQFYVANILNRVRVQKLDYYGDRLENATFNLYQTYSTWQRDGYMLVEEGSADTEHIGMYRNPAVVDENGELKDRIEILSDEVKAWDIGTTLSEGSAGVGGLDLEGSIIFPSKFDTYIYGSQADPYRVNPNDTSTYIEEGEYVILEVKSPSDGYLVNETPIVVTVNDDGVFADAGEVNDGVRVGQYAGWVLNSMSHFAAESAVDETLTFLSTTLQVQDGNGGLTSPVEGDITWLNKFSNENHRYIFLAEDVGRYVTSGRNLYQYTDAGIPQLQIKQNSYVEARVIILDGNYAEYHGPVTVNKTNLVDNSTYTLRGNATNGTLAFWLRKAEAEGGGQTLKSVEIDGQVLTEGKDYHVYTPNVTDLSDTDISGLFSVETLVQVYDQSVGNLEVSKETEAVAPGSAADEELFFYRVYSVYEHATRIALAETDENGEVKVNADGTPVLNKEFTGTLNVRLRQILEDATTQMTATNVAVKFTNGVGLIYLEPSYSVEHIYIPENENHPAHGLVGVVEIRITLDDPVSGTAQETGRHIAFDIKHNHTIRFTDGVGILYHDPTFVIETVELGDITYYANPADGQKGFEATSRFNYANIEQVQNLSANSEVSVTFTEADGTSSSQERVVTKVDNSNVTVKSDDNGGYKLEYNLLSDTNEQAVVGQFALHAGQRIHIEGLSGGTVYYIYEYAAGSGEEAGRTELLDEWTTEIKITPQGVNEGSEPIDDHYDEVIQDELPEYRAARGIIRPNATQRVDFTNTGRVGQLTISKAVTGAQATENDRQTTFSFTVTLKDKDGTPLKGTYSYTGSAIDGVEKPADGTLKLNNGTATFTLRHGQSITIQDIPKEASYEVAESDNSGYTTTVEGDGDADGTIKENTASHVAFTNMKLSTFAFTKVASENHRQVLPGAEFMLFRLQCTDGSHDHSQVINPDNPGNCWECVDAQTSGDDGGVSFQGLSPNNEYRLVETKAPDGRVLPAGQWRITTNAENELTIEAVDDGSQRPPAFATDNGNRILPNMRPIDIPSSGGFGAWPFLLVGGLLMLTALGIILVKKSCGNYTASK